MAEPIMDQYAKISAYDVHEYKVRCTFGAGTAMTYRSRDAVPTRPTATTLVVTLPKTYAEVIGFRVGRQVAGAAATTEWVLTVNNVAVDGTMTFESRVAAGTATTPATGDIAYLTIDVSSDTLNDRFTG